MPRRLITYRTDKMLKDISQIRPDTAAEPVSVVMHGVEIKDPYRWLEEQDSPRTRKWIQEQTQYARAYFGTIPQRERIQQRLTEFLTVETYEMPCKAGNRYFFRKRAAEQEQPSIYMRCEGSMDDVLLVDPSALGPDPYISVSISHISVDGRLLLYEVKYGGERSGKFQLFDVDQRQTLSDSLPRGFLRGFLFSVDGRGFYYVHETIGAERPHYRAAYYHAIGTQSQKDEEVFFAGEASGLRLAMKGDSKQLCFTTTIIGEDCGGKLYLYDLAAHGPAKRVFLGENPVFGLELWEGRLFATTNLNAPNLRVVEMAGFDSELSMWPEVVPEFSLPLKSFTVIDGRILAKYVNSSSPCIRIFDLKGTELHRLLFPDDETNTLQIHGSTPDEIFYKRESFINPPAIMRYVTKTEEHQLFAQTVVPQDTSDFVSIRLTYPSKDGTLIPMYLVAKKDISPSVIRPTILTGYGGFGTSMTPKFGILTSFMIEQGCLFALSCLRGGSELGEEWYLAARGRKRQNAFDDFISAAEWLVTSGYTTSAKLAIFGGSNSGLLMGAALTQRPDLFRAVLCIAPILDMLRYQHFDFARNWRSEYGVAEDPEDFAALHAYSPYHRVIDGVGYPAVLLVSGDMDMCCNPMHARKMAARLQTASTSGYPVVLDYNPARGHRPVMPLSERIKGLTDRLAFLCDQLEICVAPETRDVGASS
jgi:prolyl oligopeptidase